MGNITPWESQIELSDAATKIIKEHAIVYLNTEERTGKSLTACMVCENCLVSKVLIVTKKKAMSGWEDLLNNWTHLCSYTVINYHSIHKVSGDFDIIIIDEAHSYISGFPKRSTIWKNVRKFTEGKPIIFASATSHAQGTQLLFNQFALSDWSPFAKFKNFYEWYKEYAERDKEGKFKMVYIGAMNQAIDYSAVDHEKVFAKVEHLFISRTRKELGFEKEPEDVLHYIELHEQTKNIYNILLKKKVLDFTLKDNGQDYLLVCDTPIKLRWALHQLEGGVLKLDNVKTGKSEYLVLGNDEKIQYIKEKWGDTDNTVIMYQYKAEKEKLERAFKHCVLLQSQSFAEGVDLSMYKNLVIYSQDFSTARHTQRRARQANRERKEDIKVNFLLVRKAVSEQVYKTCSLNKKNFVDSTFERTSL